MANTTIAQQQQLIAGIRGSDVDKTGPWRTRTNVDIDMVNDPLDLCPTCQGLYVAAKAKQEVGNPYDSILLCAPCSKPFFKRLKAARDAVSEVERRKDVRSLEQRFLQDVKSGWRPTRDEKHHPIGLLLPNGKVVYTEARMWTVGETHEVRTFGQPGIRSIDGQDAFIEVRIPEVRVMVTAQEFARLNGWTELDS